MSVQAMAWVIDHSPVDIRGGEYLVMLMIANHIGKTGEAAFAGAVTLADEARLSKTQTLACIKKLEARSYVLVERGSGRGHLSRYRLPGFEQWLIKVKGLDLLIAEEKVNSVDPLEGERGKPLDLLGNEKGSNPQKERVKSDGVKGQVSSTPPTPPYKAEPYLTVKKPSAHARLMAFHAGRIVGPLPDPAAQGNAVKVLLENYTPDDCEKVYTEMYAEGWRHTPVTWLTVRKEIGSRLSRPASQRTTADAPFGYTPNGKKILSDDGDRYTVMGDDGTPSKRWRTPEAFASDTGRDLQEVLARWN